MGTLKEWIILDKVNASDLNEMFKNAIPFFTADGAIAAGDPIFVQGQNIKILEPSDDAWVDSGSPTVNNGTDTEVRTGGAGTDYEGYVKFDLTGAPSSSEVVKAYLILSHDRISDSGTANFNRITSTWDEGTVTWNIKPTVTATNKVDVNQNEMGNSSVGAYAIDITTLYGDIMDNTNYGIRIVTAGATGTHTFASKENATAGREPRLIVFGANANAGEAQKLTDVVDPEQRMGFAGFAINGVADGETVFAQREGVVTGLSGLTAGERYFVQATGTLGTTVTAIYAGIALSATALFTQRPKRQLVAQVKLYAPSGTSRTSRNQCPLLPGADLAYVQHVESLDLGLKGDWIDEFDQLDNAPSRYLSLVSGIMQDTDTTTDPTMTSVFNMYKTN